MDAGWLGKEKAGGVEPKAGAALVVVVAPNAGVVLPPPNEKAEGLAPKAEVWPKADVVGVEPKLLVVVVEPRKPDWVVCGAVEVVAVVAGCGAENPDVGVEKLIADFPKENEPVPNDVLACVAVGCCWAPNERFCGAFCPDCCPKAGLPTV